MREWIGCEPWPVWISSRFLTTGSFGPRIFGIRIEWEGDLLDLPVVVSVQLARKRIELGTLRSLAPGSLVTFEKSCEDLLDLYVSNRLFCRGEAVKVGEKFGLKINEMGFKRSQWTCGIPTLHRRKST